MKSEILINWLAGQNWTINTDSFQIVSGENGIEIINRGNGCYRIEISKSSIELHDGELVCTAINDHGQAESRARIVVEPVEMDSRSAPTFVKDIEDQVREKISD